MSKETENRLEEIARWYYYNEKTIPVENLGKRMEFYQIAVSNLLELCVRQQEDIRRCEGRPKSTNLWLPDGMKMAGDVKRFG